MSKARRLPLIVVGVVLVVAGAAAYLYDANARRQAEAAEVVIQEGIAQFFLEEHEQAVQTFNSIPEGAEGDWRVFYYKGAALIKLGDFEGAVRSLEEALLLNENEKDIPFALGVAYYKLGNLSLSKGYFHTVLEIDPKHAEAKGLMDIMARLERYQVTHAEAEGENTSVTESQDSSGDE